MNRVYACIDLKSFYASVECVERNLNPLTTNLVVADNSRTNKTVCLAVTPSLKKYGIGGRARLFEVLKKVKEVNFNRRRNAFGYKFTGKSFDDVELSKNNNLELDFITAVPRMKHYMDYSTKIYNVYLKYLDKSDIYVYSIDEVFCDITNYLKIYKMTPKELVTMMIRDVYKTTGITATAGIGSNLFLCKIAMDIVAKHASADEYGVRIAELDEQSYKEKLWGHRPITDFWRVGRGYAKRLESYGIYTMGDIARLSISNEELLYRLFGVNAEFLIDHAWGLEPVTIKDIKNSKPSNKSIGSGQVLHSAYSYEKAKLVLNEMADLLSLSLVDKELITDMLILNVAYDIENLTNPNYSKFYKDEVVTDFYGRTVPKPAHGTIRLDYKTSSTKLICEGFLKLYERVVNDKLLIKKINICAGNLSNKGEEKKDKYYQFNLFSDVVEQDELIKKEKLDLKSEEEIQKVMLDIKNKFGKNAILKGMDLQEGATTKDRNNQIGGHRA